LFRLISQTKPRFQHVSSSSGNPSGRDLRMEGSAACGKDLRPFAVFMIVDGMVGTT
jgi:hypothetical protein